MPRNNHGAANAGMETPVYRSRRRMLLSLLLLLLLVNALFFVVLLKPAGERAREQREGLDRLRADVKTRRETISRLRRIAQNLGDAQRQDAEFYRTKFLPKTIGFSIIMEEVDKIARGNRVRKGAVSYSLADVRNRPDLNQVEITTVVEGDYGNIVQFINQVEKSPLFLIIDNITAAGGAPMAGQPRVVRLSLRLVTFFQVA